MDEQPDILLQRYEERKEAILAQIDALKVSNSQLVEKSDRLEDLESENRCLRTHLTYRSSLEDLQSAARMLSSRDVDREAAHNAIKQLIASVRECLDLLGAKT